MVRFHWGKGKGLETCWAGKLRISDGGHFDMVGSCPRIHRVIFPTALDITQSSWFSVYLKMESTHKTTLGYLLYISNDIWGKKRELNWHLCFPSPPDITTQYLHGSPAAGHLPAPGRGRSQVLQQETREKDQPRHGVLSRGNAAGILYLPWEKYSGMCI